MLNKIFITIIIICGIARADFLDNTNRDLCEIDTGDTTVAISCDIIENTEQVKSVLFEMHHNGRECAEYIAYEDGTLKYLVWFINKNNKGVVGSQLTDEYNVEIALDANETTVDNIKKLCMERYKQYKEAKSRL